MRPKTAFLLTSFAAALGCATPRATIERATPAVTPDPSGATARNPLHGAPRPFRRVVTGMDAVGRSTIVSDGPVPVAARASYPPELVAQAPFLRFVSVANVLWIADGVPVDLADPRDPVERGVPAEDGAPENGVIAGIMRYEPGLEFPMHATRSLDVVIVVSGALELKLDAGSTVVRAGDVVVQRGTRHSWKVVGAEPAVIASVLLDARALPAASPAR